MAWHEQIGFFLKTTKKLAQPVKKTFGTISGTNMHSCVWSERHSKWSPLSAAVQALPGQPVNHHWAGTTRFVETSKYHPRQHTRSCLRNQFYNVLLGYGYWGPGTFSFAANRSPRHFPWITWSFTYSSFFNLQGKTRTSKKSWLMSLKNLLTGCQEKSARLRKSSWS